MPAQAGVHDCLPKRVRVPRRQSPRSRRVVHPAEGQLRSAEAVPDAHVGRHLTVVYVRVQRQVRALLVLGGAGEGGV